jgi:serine-type D-Ala-D-Ala carboxypeptidase/endopeptidase (penicillin-binding protein 4)
MRFYLGIVVLIACLFNHAVFSETASEKINTLIHQQLPHATVGIFVKDADTGNVVYSKHADKLLFPASSMKLFTAAAALYYFKQDHHFETTLLEKNKNIYLKFDGSPSLTKKDLVSLLEQLKANKITYIEGDFVLDTSRFKAPDYPNGVSYEDLGWYYAAPDTAIMLDENTETYAFISAKKQGEHIQVKPKTSQPALTLINQVITVSQEQARNHCELNIDIMPKNTLRLFGCLADNAQPRLMNLAIPDPILLATQVIKKTLKKNNITLKGKIILGRTPTDAKPIASIQSRELVALITHMLKESDNLYANTLTKQLGYALTHEGSYKQGAFAIKTILHKHTQVDMAQIDLADGMGTRYNLVTPEQIVVLLNAIDDDEKLKPIFMKALPEAGISGTLQDRMKKTVLEKKVFAKTGTMHDISSLSGYMINAQGKKLIFSIMINGVNQPISRAKSLEEKILLILHDV